MRAARTADRLVRCYPPGWRARYGEELCALVVDMSGDARVSLRTRTDLLWGAARERWRAAGLGPDGPRDQRVRGGVSAVLWAWALFLFAGALVQKTSEHWQQGLASGGQGLPTIAFDVLIGGAVLASVLVVIGIGVALPTAWSLIRGGGWSRIARRFYVATAASFILVMAFIALVHWAHRLSDHQRAGANTAYALAFLGWALLGLVVLLLWTAAAVTVERCVQLPAWRLRVQGRLAAGVAGAMAVMTVSTAVWWIAVAERAPAALIGSRAVHASAAVPQLIIALTLMLLASAVGLTGARQATRALAVNAA